jgi:hypothetical protein
MIIEYLKYLESKVSNIQGKYYEVLEIEKINNLETTVDLIFPKAYKEFLYLTGGRPKIFDSGINSGITYAIVRQKKIKEFLKKEYNFSIDKDFWVIAELDLEQFYFFYFNDPDAENQENPPVYFFKGYEIEEGENASSDNIYLSDETFSEFVNSYAKARMLAKGFSIE